MRFAMYGLHTIIKVLKASVLCSVFVSVQMHLETNTPTKTTNVPYQMHLDCVLRGFFGTMPRAYFATRTRTRARRQPPASRCPHEDILCDYGTSSGSCMWCIWAQCAVKRRPTTTTCVHGKHFMQCATKLGGYLIITFECSSEFFYSFLVSQKQFVLFYFVRPRDCGFYCV